ncbi:hypothetical protein ACHAQH_007966 [Verticillium albo-atrum]
MGLSRLLVVLVTSVLTLSQLSAASPVQPPLEWEPADRVEPPNPSRELEFEQATLRVPLDYTKPESKEEIHLDLLRIKAKKQPSRGSIIYNPGGPGLPMRKKLARDSDMLIWLSTDEFDIVTFDARGTETTMPFSCGNLDPAFAHNKNNHTIPAVYERSGVIADQCETHAEGKSDAELIGTVALARDTMRVVDALGEDGMLRYWGYSYGTIAGTTIAAMYPDRIDKMILDGVVNPHKWYKAPSDPDMTIDADNALMRMVETCFDLGEEKCKLAAHGTTAQDLYAKVWRRIDDLKVKAVHLPVMMSSFWLSTRIVEVDHHKAISHMTNALVNRSLWPRQCLFLRAMMEETGSDAYEAAKSNVQARESSSRAGDSSSASSYIDKRGSRTRRGRVSEDDRMLGAHMAIRCGDKIQRAESFDGYENEMQMAYNSSRVSGDRFAGVGAVCAQWPWHANEVYEGDFNVTTKNPVLIMSTELDPRTPLVAARAASASLQGSQVLYVEGAGHCSTSVPSLCMAEHVMNYWSSGTMPEPGKVCKETPLGTKWSDIRKEWNEKRPIHKRDIDGLYEGFGRLFLGAQDPMDYFTGSDVFDPML